MNLWRGAIGLVRFRSPGSLICLAFLVFLIARALIPSPIDSQNAGDDNANESRRIANKLQCPVCEGTSVADSRAAIALDMRRTISEKLAAGEREPQILQYFVDRYGVAVLRDPPSGGFYAAVWWVPAVALMAGAGVVLLLARRRTPQPAGTEPLGADLEGYRRRIHDLEGGDR